MSDRPIREYRAILTVDIEDYSSRTDAEQRDLQSALMTALDHAADAAELNREQWVRQLGGDALTALLPPGTDLEDLLDVFVRRPRSMSSTAGCRTGKDQRRRRPSRPTATRVRSTWSWSAKPSCAGRWS